MKALKIIGIIVLVLVVAVVIAMFVAPTDMNVERTVEINAPKALVHKHVSNLRLMNEWSPWAKLDPNMKNEYVGTDGTVGSLNKWEGNDSVGKGEQEITFISDDSITTQVRFKEPFESNADAYIVLKENGPASTTVTWGFKSEMARPFNIMGLFMDMEASIGNDYQKGLDSLKAITEREAANSQPAQYQIEEITFPETHYAYFRDTLKFSEMESFFGTHFGNIYTALGKDGKQPGTPTGIYFAWDTVKNETDLAAAVPFTPAGEVKGFTNATYGGKALKIDYYGAYEASENAHYAMDGYIHSKGLTFKGPVLEQYITDPTTEPDTSKWLTTIIYFVE